MYIHMYGKPHVRLLKQPGFAEEEEEEKKRKKKKQQQTNKQTNWFCYLINLVLFW